MKNLLLCTLLVGGVASAEPLAHSNDTGLQCHGCNPDWIDAVGLLFPDVAFVLGSGDFNFELSLECDPQSVGQNLFAMEYAHLPYQPHEAGCWVAFDYAADGCASRSAYCGSGGGTIQAGMSADAWESECVAAAAYEREVCIDNLP